MGPPRHLVVAGASLAGLSAAREAVRCDPDVRVTVLGAERWLPYDRPPLSKELGSQDPEAATSPPPLPGAAELAAHERIYIRLGEPALALDAENRRLVVTTGTIPYDAVVLATGSTPRTLPIALPRNVFYLRTWDDAVAIRTALGQIGAGRLVVIGAGFIGSEIAAAAHAVGIGVTLVEAAETPLERAVGRTAGTALAALHRRRGIDLVLGRTTTAIEGSPDVSRVILDDGSSLAAEAVIVGVGAEPAVGWLAHSGLLLDNGVVCDQFLRTNQPGVFAAGDIARWHNPVFGRSMRLEHWTSAHEQGTRAAANALSPNGPTPFTHVPYVWSDWDTDRIQLAGTASGEPFVVDGSWEGEAFTALYAEGERLVGALTLNRRADIMKYRALISRAGTLDDARRLARERAGSRSERKTIRVGG